MSRRRTALLVAVVAATALTAFGVRWAVEDGSSAAAAGTHVIGVASPLPPPLPTVAGRVASAEEAFALTLLKQASKRDNVTVAPASLAIALAMLGNGAGGRTRTEIAKVLAGADDNAGWHALTTEWATVPNVTLDTANGTWLQSGFPVRQPYLDTLRTYYDSGVWTVDFAHQRAQAKAAIDNWTAQQTHGKIAKLFDELDPQTRLVLANAVYFRADWAHAFDAHDTKPGPFVRADGQTVTAQFMSDHESRYPVALTPDYTAVQLPYQGDRFAALAIMPTRQSLTEFVAGLEKTRIWQIAAELRAESVDLALPRFTTRSDLDLVTALKAMGMPSAFSPTNADFSRMTPESVMVGQVKQRTYLAVGEKGTEAAAVTGVEMVPMSAPAPPTAQVHLDRPFLFLVRDTKTGAILFATTVQDPTAD